MPPGDEHTLAEGIGLLTDEVRGLRVDVRDERHGRRLSVRLLIAAFVVVAVVLSGWFANYRAEQASKADQTCEIRTVGRADVRDAISAAVDEVGRYAELTPSERAQLAGRVTLRVRKELPPPTC